MEHTLDLEITQGTHTLIFKCAGKDKRSSGFFFGIDQIDHIGLKSEPKPKLEVSDAQTIRTRLKKLLRRAFRRPVSTTTVERFAEIAENELSDGATWDASMRTVVSAILGMPDFLYIYEDSETD